MSGRGVEDKKDEFEESGRGSRRRLWRVAFDLEDDVR